MILITGASSGIGAACARALAREKRDLFLVARRKDRLVTLANELKEKHPVEVRISALDVKDRGAVEKFFLQHGSLMPCLEGLVNNAGLARGLDTVANGNIDDWDEMIDTNIKGLLYVTRQCLPHFLQKKRGHIINMGSIAGRWIYPKGNVYCATKSAIKTFNETLRLDLHGSGIRVTEISPGLVETEFSEIRFRDKERAKSVYANTDVLRPEDIAEAVAWVLTRPPHVNIQEMVIYPTDQAGPGLVYRRHAT